MAFHPFPLDCVMTQRGVQTFPEIDILNRFLIRGFPATLFPVVDPLSNPLTHILAVGADHDIAIFF
ncbi:hypothetical protein D3C86_2108740 [compost metagenome]